MEAVMTATLFQIVAHQGGWDEILMVAAPLAVIGLLLWLANRRVTAQLAESAASSESPSGDPGPVPGADEQR